MLIGLISDTHGPLRPQALSALQACDHLIHAGDIGDLSVLAALTAIAPLTAIRGNNDVDPAYAAIAETACVTLADTRILVLHDLKRFHPSMSDEPIDVVISGHSHKPLIERREGRLYINPGSAGPRRFRLPVTIAYLRLSANAADAELVHLAV